MKTATILKQLKEGEITTLEEFKVLLENEVKYNRAKGNKSKQSKKNEKK